LIPVEWEWDNGSYLRSPLLDAKTVPEADLVCIPLPNDGYIEAPTATLGRLVRRAHREANEDELLSSFELITEINGDNQQTCLAIPVSELLAMTGITGLQNTLTMLADRVQEANLETDPASPVMSRPTMVSLPPDAWHTLSFSYPMATRPAAEISKAFDLFVITRLDDNGAISETVDAEVKTDRRYFASGNIFVELSHKDRASGLLSAVQFGHHLARSRRCW
jgi:hypothetical protein